MRDTESFDLTIQDDKGNDLATSTGTEAVLAKDNFLPGALAIAQISPQNQTVSHANNLTI